MGGGEVVFRPGLFEIGEIGGCGGALGGHQMLQSGQPEGVVVGAVLRAARPFVLGDLIAQGLGPFVLGEQPTFVQRHRQCKRLGLPRFIEDRFIFLRG